MTNSFQKLLKTCSKSFSKTKSKVHADPSTSSAQEELRVTSTSSGSNRFSAFSLIEISVVILIIGILVAGVTQSSKLIKYSRLNSARSLTQSSPVAGISDLMLWYETSLESSFLEAEQTDGSTISTWYDNSPQSTVKNNASLNIGNSIDTGDTNCTSPKFYEGVFSGGIPAVRFNGLNGVNNSSTSTGDCLRFNGTDLVGSNYTVFVVEQLRVTADQRNAGFFGGMSQTSYQNLFFGYDYNAGSTSVKVDPYGHGVAYTNSSLVYTTPTPRIHTARFSTTDGTSYWLNGGTNAEASNSGDSYKVSLTAYPNASLGRTRTNGVYKFFIGDLSEIIIYTRALKTEERQAVEEYLSKKYAITIS